MNISTLTTRPLMKAGNQQVVDTISQNDAVEFFSRFRTTTGRTAALLPLDERDLLTAIENGQNLVTIEGDSYVVLPVPDSGRFGKSVITNGKIEYIGSQRFAAHDPVRWLVDTVEDMPIHGLGRTGSGMYWVSYGEEGNGGGPMVQDIAISLLATTANTGQAKTSIVPAGLVLQCTNQLTFLMRQHKVRGVQVKHTTNSDLKHEATTTSISLLTGLTDRVNAEVERLMSITVGNDIFVQAVRQDMLTTRGITTRPTEGRAETMWDKEFNARVAMLSDSRVPQSNDAWSALMAHDTYSRWGAKVNGAKTAGELSDRRLNDIATGVHDDSDDQFMAIVSQLIEEDCSMKV